MYIIHPGCFHSEDTEVFAECCHTNRDGFAHCVATCDTPEQAEALAQILNGLQKEQLEPLQSLITPENES